MLILTQKKYRDGQTSAKDEEATNKIGERVYSMLIIECTTPVVVHSIGREIVNCAYDFQVNNDDVLNIY